MWIFRPEWNRVNPELMNVYYGAVEEINRSNWSKFVDGKPVFKPNGKVGKGPNYFEPNLDSLV